MRVFTVLSVALITAASPAFAGEAKEAVKFRFDRAALSTDRGAEAVYRAMRASAESKCDPRGDNVRSAVTACADDLVSQWVTAAGDERLAALHADQG